jgi:hypothetical protein
MATSRKTDGAAGMPPKWWLATETGTATARIFEVKEPNSERRPGRSDMALTTAPTPSAPASWAVAAVLGYLSDEADHHAQIAKRLRDLSDISRQEEIVEAINSVRELAATSFPTR